MEITQLFNEILQKYKIRVIGTKENPLFLAADIGKAFSFKDIGSVIRDFGGDEKGLHRMQTLKGNQNMIFLTEKGLYHLLEISNKPEAKKFQEWIYRVIHEVRLTGHYNLEEDIQKQKNQIDQNQEKSVTAIQPSKRESELEASIAEKEKRIQQLEKLIPIPESDLKHYHPVDINDYIDDPAIYLYGLGNHKYKFGRSGEMKIRSKTHDRNFKKHGYEPDIIKIWVCDTMQIMTKVESCIKTFIWQNKIGVDDLGQKEIFETNNIAPVIVAVGKYVDKHNAQSKIAVENKRLNIELIKAEAARSQAEANKIEAINRSKELKIEKIKFRSQPIFYAPIEPPKKDKWDFTALEYNIASDSLDDLNDFDDLNDLDEIVDNADNAISNMDADTITCEEKQIIESLADTEPNTRQIITTAPIDTQINPQAVPIIKPTTKAKNNQGRAEKLERVSVWVGQNPPNDNEQVSLYFARYTAENTDIISVPDFNKIVSAVGYKNVKKSKYNIWRKL